MLEDLPIIIPIVAIVLAIMDIPGIKLLRESAVIFSLGSGIIYLSIPALVLYLLVENRFHPIYRGRTAGLVSGVLIVAGILGLTALSPITDRTYSELAQLFLYILLYFLFTSALRDGQDIMRFLRASVCGSMAVCVLAYTAVLLGWQGAPDVYVGRGANEGSIFVTLLGTIPACVMLARTRNPFYAIAIILFFYIPYLATSRGGLVVSAVSVLTTAFFFTRSFILRSAMVVSGVVLAIRNTPIFLNVFEGQINFSARERIALIEYGLDLMRDRFWTGWGWGSTNRLAEAAPNTRLNYPHFHNTYIQLIVELGVFGCILIFFIVVFLGYYIYKALYIYKGNPAASVLIIATSLGIILSGVSDAMIFGADRFIQLVFLFGLIVRTTAVWQEQNGMMPLVARSEGQFDGRSHPGALGS